MIDKLIDLVENGGPNTVKVVVALGIVAALFFGYTPKSPLTSNTVMITNLARNSGGTGVVVDSGNSLSRIGSNRHVCGVIKGGGVVTTNNGSEHAVVSYIESDEHDLCLITVAANLGTAAVLADRPPRMFESATVVGHPALLPSIRSDGHFSASKIIAVLTGFRQCTEEELKDPEIGLFCMIVGGFPLVKQYESIVVTSLIMGGSSGSAVYNSDGELSALIFAGSGSGLSYAFAVPYSYLRNFLLVESKTKEAKVPNYNMSFSDLIKGNKTKAKDFCKVQSTNKLCKTINYDMIYE